MSNLNIETGQNVFIQKELANVGERIGAQLIDFGIILTYIIAINIIINFISDISGIRLDFLTIIFIAPIFFYSLLSEIFMHGQSFGKKLLKIKVVKISGGQPTFGNYVVRWMFRLIDIIFLYGSVAIITIVANGRGQRFGDIVAKTSVISLKKRKSLKDTMFIETENEYEPVYHEVENLNESDIKTIKDVVLYYKKNITSPIAIDMIKRTTKAIKEKIKITSSDVPLLFLETILKDYNSLHKNN